MPETQLQYGTQNRFFSRSWSIFCTFPLQKHVFIWFLWKTRTGVWDTRDVFHPVVHFPQQEFKMDQLTERNSVLVSHTDGRNSVTWIIYPSGLCQQETAVINKDKVNLGRPYGMCVSQQGACPTLGFLNIILMTLFLPFKSTCSSFMRQVKTKIYKQLAWIMLFQAHLLKT